LDRIAMLHKDAIVTALLMILWTTSYLQLVHGHERRGRLLSKSFKLLDEEN